MLQIKTSVVAAENGSRKAVVESGTTSMSLSWISWKPRIDDPSKPMPSLIASASTALGGTEKCCQVPGRSVKRKSIISTFLVLTALRTSSVVEQLRNICCPPVSDTGRASLRRVTLTCKHFQSMYFSFREAHASASALLQCVSRFRHLLFCLPFRKRKLFARPRQLPAHHVLPIVVARSPGCRFRGFSWRHTPHLRE